MFNQLLNLKKENPNDANGRFDERYNVEGNTSLQSNTRKKDFV